MSCKLSEYMNDGANYQARAVLCFLQRDLEELEYELNEKFREINIARWENCREQGYIIYLKNKTSNKQLNIVFYEHCNSDSICCLKFEQCSINSINIDTINKDFFKDKYDYTKDFSYGNIKEASNWISVEIINWYNSN